MKLNVALFFAGLFGALAGFFILLSFGTDYWLLASETCKKDSSGNVKHGVNSTTFYHEGLFSCCSVKMEREGDCMFQYFFENQMQTKECKPAYLFPFPVSPKTHNETTYDSAIIYRGFWSVFLLLGVTAVILGGFFIICGAPFSSYCLYKTGGALFFIAGFFILLATVLYVIWFELMNMVTLYKDYQKEYCSEFQLNIYYGPSFVSAPVGVFFCLLSGLLFLLIARTICDEMAYGKHAHLCMVAGASI